MNLMNLISNFPNLANLYFLVLMLTTFTGIVLGSAQTQVQQAQPTQQIQQAPPQQQPPPPQAPNLLNSVGGIFKDAAKLAVMETVRGNVYGPGYRPMTAGNIYGAPQIHPYSAPQMIPSVAPQMISSNSPQVISSFTPQSIASSALVNVNPGHAPMIQHGYINGAPNSVAPQIIASTIMPEHQHVTMNPAPLALVHPSHVMPSATMSPQFNPLLPRVMTTHHNQFYSHPSQIYPQPMMHQNPMPQYYNNNNYYNDFNGIGNRHFPDYSLGLGI